LGAGNKGKNPEVGQKPIPLGEDLIKTTHKNKADNGQGCKGKFPDPDPMVLPKFKQLLQFKQYTQCALLV
jgi:hypothetical protein